jgi:hypothetical protein
VLAADSKDGALVLENLYSPERLSQTVSLAPGHYLLRALAKTNVFQVHVFAESSRLPVAVSGDYQWVELPFCITHFGEDTHRAAQVGFRYLARPATGNASRLPARLSVKKVELIPLGDTMLSDRWAQTLPADPLHRLKSLEESPAWSREGKVVFQDAFIGTELWLLTQGGKVDHSYVGHPRFQPRRQVPAHRVATVPSGTSQNGRFRAASERRLEGARLVVSLGTEATARGI